MKLFTYTLFSALFICCSQTQGIDTPSNNTTSQRQPMNTSLEIEYQKEKNYVIFYKDKNKTLLTDKDITTLETIIKKSITEYNVVMKKNRPNDSYAFLQEYSTYKFQFVPQLNTNGELEVWVNCFCSDSQNKWLKEIIHVMDGGPCYFNLKINLTTKTHFDLKVNGIA